MELFRKYTPENYIKTAYLYMRNTILSAYMYLILFKALLICFHEMDDMVAFLDILIHTLVIGSFVVIIHLESYGVSRKKLLFMYSEAINIATYIYGFYIKANYKDVYMITSAVLTCGLQLVGSSYFENILIIFKLVLVWLICPVLLGYQNIPTDPSPYMAFIMMILVISTLFTYRRKIEEEYSQAIITIHKMKIQLFNIIQAMSECVIIFSENQEVLLFNIASSHLFKEDSSDAIKEQLLTVKYSIDSEDIEATHNSLYEDILIYLGSDREEGVTFGINELNGLSYEWRGTKSEWDGSKIVILTARDISSLISYERSKAEAESKIVLLRTVSHEIRTPTNTILALSDSLIEAHPNYRHIDKVKIINVSSKLLLNMINDLIDFSRIIADCFSVNKCEVKLRDFIQETYSLFSIQADQKHLEYSYYIDPLLPEIIISDPNRLRQVILNLVSNSLKFTLHGKIRLEALLTEQCSMIIKVIDTGVGIPPNAIKHLFDPFFSTRDLRLNPQGCGLGLYISNKFVLILGRGSINVSSILNEGSVFSFDVDIGMVRKMIIESTEEELKETNVSNERLFETLPRNIIIHDSFMPIRPDILIVDDNEFNLLVMRNFLSSAGYKFDEAKSGEEAVDKVFKANAVGSHIKVVVMDFQMPGMSGPEAAREILSLYQDKKITYFPSIIGYSADEADDSNRICHESGMKECLSKSSSKNAFLSIIKKYIN